MKNRLLTLLFICFLGFILVAGCTGETETALVEPVDEASTALTSPLMEGETPPETKAVVTESLSSTTSAPDISEKNGIFNLPLSSPPADLMVSVSTQKDPIYNTITVRFDGGSGQNVVKSAMAGVTFSDGRTETQELNPTSGSTITFEGTSGMDVVEVVVSYMNGESYKILAEAVGFLRAVIENEPYVAKEVASAPSGDIGYEGPVTSPPNDLRVSVNVEKETIYKTITTTFRGGSGQNLVRKVDVLTILSDGSSSENVLDPRTGSTVIVDGTSGIDRVQVVITYLDGKSYKILDAELGARGGMASN